MTMTIRRESDNKDGQDHEMKNLIHGANDKYSTVQYSKYSTIQYNTVQEGTRRTLQ